MKKILIPLILVILCLSVAQADAQTKFRAFTALTGGGTGAIDKIPIAELTNGDIAFTVTADYFYVHRFDSAATTAESSPTYIRPDDYATAGVWELQGLYGASVAGIPSTEPTIAFKDVDATAGDDNATISVNCTDTGNGSEDCDITFKSQTAGALTTRLTIDADGNVVIDKAQLGDSDGTGAITITGLTTTRAKTFSDAAATVMEQGQSQGGYLFGDSTPDSAGETGFDGTDKYSFFGANSEDFYFRVGSSANIVQFGSATGVTGFDFQALNLATTGTITGAIKINSDANGMSSAEMTTAGMYGTFFVASGAGTWALPAAVSGMSLCVYSTTAAAVVINPDDSDVITLNGTALSAGDSITSASGAGDFICLVAVSDASWLTMGRSGTWTDTN